MTGTDRTDTGQDMPGVLHLESGKLRPVTTSCQEQAVSDITKILSNCVCN